MGKTHAVIRYDTIASRAHIVLFHNVFDICFAHLQGNAPRSHKLQFDGDIRYGLAFDSCCFF